MKTKYAALAGAALVALSTGLASADEQDDEVRRLNLEQLEKARGAASETTAPTVAPASPDGQGGPEFQAPPTPEEGMTDEPASPTEEETAPSPDDETATEPPPAGEDEPVEPDAEEEEETPQQPPI